jgi:misacylated tRNA(Ala) deacylase
MTTPLFLTDPMSRIAQGTVLAHTADGGLILDASLFYPTGGGQPGDTGVLTFDGQDITIAATVKGEAGQVVLVPASPDLLPPVGAEVTQTLDWDRRHRHMRMHTALHLLTVVIPLPVTGGAIGADKSRLDFVMPEPPTDVPALNAALNDLIAQDLPVSSEWITEAELDANPALVKTLSVQPPRGAGRIRLVRIGQGDGMVDLQPCGGTHVARTGEIGPVQIGKIENKGKQNRRVSLLLS